METFKKTSLVRGLCMAACSAAIVLMAQPASAELRRVTIGTNPQGTMYFVVGGGLSKLFYDKLNIQASAQPHAGSSVYLPLVQSGEVTLGFSSALDTNLAYNGRESYEKIGALTKLRSLTRIWPLPYSLFARADSGMTQVSDLKGKKVAINFKANAALDAANRAILRAAGLNPETDVENVTISGIPEGYKLVSSGGVAAAATALGIPLARKAHASVPGGIVILAVNGEGATDEALGADVPGLYMAKSKPGKNNPGVSEEINITGFDIFLLTSADLSEDDAYTLVKTVHENFAQLQKDYPVLRRNKPEQLSWPTNTAPFHPGAIRYFKEAGLWSDANDAREAKLSGN